MHAALPCASAEIFKGEGTNILGGGVQNLKFMARGLTKALKIKTELLKV